MDDPKQKGLLSQLIPDEIENLLGLGDNNPDAQNTRAIELLKTTAGGAGGEVENEMNDFLSGRGALLETTRAAVARGGSSAVNDVAEFLTKQLKLSAPLAKLLAPLIVKIFPAVGDLAGAVTPEKPKRKRRKKKEESSSKPSKPRKPKPSSSTRPASSSKPKPKPKPSSSSKPKPRKKPKRSVEIETGTNQEE